MADQGIVPVLHFDQCWDKELTGYWSCRREKCVLNPDGMTNLRKDSEIVGDHMAVMGDVLSTLFAIGTPEEIRNYVRDLVRDIGPQGLLLSRAVMVR